MSDTALASEWLPLASAQLDFWEEHLAPGQTLSTVAHCTELCGAVEEERSAGRSPLPSPRRRRLPCALVSGVATLLRRYGTIHNAYRHYNASICKRTAIPGEAAQSLMREDIAQRQGATQRAIAAAWLLKLGPGATSGTCVRTIFWLMASAWP